MAFVTTRNLERRCRYRLALHNMRMHKVEGYCEPVYYLYEPGEDDSIPDDSNRFFTLDELVDYCGTLAEQEALAHA